MLKWIAAFENLKISKENSFSRKFIRKAKAIIGGVL